MIQKNDKDQVGTYMQNMIYEVQNNIIGDNINIFYQQLAWYLVCTYVGDQKRICDDLL